MSSQISTAVTYSSQCARSLLSTILQSLQRRHKPSSLKPILLFAFAPSPTTPPDVLSHLISTLTQLYPKHVGCISAPLPFQYLDANYESYSCSLAYAFVNGVSFRSTISGPAEAHVGRWHAARKQATEDTRKAIPLNAEDSRMQTLSNLPGSGGMVDWDRVWNRGTATSATCSLSSRHGNGFDSETLPSGLRNIDPSAINNIFYFSDRAPEGLATVLQDAFPHANKFSLIASSTPFITGRPVTLFYDGLVLSDGAVGVAFTSPFSPPPVIELSFPPLVALTRDLDVTSSEGNLILSLDSGNPTQLLLNAIRKHGIPSHTTWAGKEDEFYIGVIDPSTQQVSQLHRISAGDPSRGGIALDAASAPREGSIVRLYYLPKDPAPDVPAYISDTTPNNISLLVAPEMASEASFGDKIASDLVAGDDCLVVSNAFLAASENGFTLSRGTQGLWKCVVPGGRVKWSL